MKRVLYYKHWELFSYMIGIPLIVHLIFSRKIVIAPIVTILFLGFFFSWFWAIGTHLHSKLPDFLKMKMIIFKVLITIPLVYLIFYLTVSYLSDIRVIQTGQPPGYASLGIWKIIFPLNIISVFCLLYVYWHSAKTIKSLELQKRVKFKDYAIDFLLMWFFPFGIWILQPRINRLIELENTTANKR